ncbi:MAG TPA: hypothetical protein EYN08_06445 [Gammaproteobacteria bacterium]|nr:hypothetical protein [Gammaproteobacteria bacterium]
MGGVAGHLSHLYDDRTLTFNKMKNILSLASSGDLVGTEKTDGYNIFLGFKDGQARAARNKGDMSRGGMTPEELAAREFKGGEKVRKVYNNSFSAYGKAINSLSREQQAAIFGPNGEIFYNTEIQGPGASNVVNYDANILSIHRAGHKLYNPETDKVEDVDVEENSKILDRVIDQFEHVLAGEEFSVRRTAVLQLKKLDDDYDLQIALAKIRKAGFDGNMTIEEYLENNLLNDVNKELSYFSDQLKQNVIDRILKKENALSLTSIYKGFPKEQKQTIRQFVRNGEELLKQAIFPIEAAIHDFAVELLRGLESAYILDNKAEVDRLKTEVGEAIKNIQAYEGQGSEVAREVLAQQLEKIRHLDNINTTVEGFVFQVGDQMYKFTGNFAPINQLLGLFRYGRGDVPPIKKAEIQEQGGDGTPDELTRRKVAVIPGKFKPPHKGHLQMVEHYAEVADVVVILISPLSRTTDGGVEISLDESKRIWEVYLDSSNIDSNNVIIAKSPYNSPVQSAYELVAGNVTGFQPAAGDLIIPGASTKPDPTSGMSDINRFARFHGIPIEKRLQGVVPANVEDYAFTPHDSAGYVMSARDFRNSIDEADINVLSQYIPESVDPELILNIIYDGEVPQKKTLTMESLYSLVNESFERTLMEVSSEKQRRWACAQTGDDFKGAQELTSKQAKEMCFSELEEGMKTFVKNIGQKASAILSGTEKEKKDIARLIDVLGINYLDPINQSREILDTAEVLQDLHRFGTGRTLSNSYDKQLFNNWLHAAAERKQKSRNVDWKTTGFLEEEELTETKPEDRLKLDTPTQAARRGGVKEVSAMGAGSVTGAGNNKQDKKSQGLIREEE